MLLVIELLIKFLKISFRDLIFLFYGSPISAIKLIHRYLNIKFTMTGITNFYYLFLYFVRFPLKVHDAVAFILLCLKIQS